MSFSRRDLLRASVVAAIAAPLVPASAFAGRASPENIVLPPRLQAGATIGLISPAGAVFDPEDAEIVKDTLAQFGLEARVGANALEQRGYLAGTDEQRAADVMAMFADNTIDGILALRGGWGVARMLPLIDYSVIERNPKFLMGFSDITALLLAIYVKTGLITFHGPTGNSTWNEFSTDSLVSIAFDGGTPLMQNPVPTSFPVPPADRIQTIHGGKAQGRLAGGNLSVLSTMIGSEFLPDWRGHLLFLEDVGEEVYRVDRMLTHLKLAGILDAVEGVIWGHCSNCTVGRARASLTLEEVMRDHLGPLGKPVFYGSSIGHIRDKLTIPIGIRAEMDASLGTIRILEPAVR